MAYDKTTFLSGLTMGLIGKGNPTFEGSGKMLYNGVELPALPVVKGYGYAAIMHSGVKDDGTVASANLLLSTMPLYRSLANNGISTCMRASASGSVIWYKTNVENGDTGWSTVNNKTYSENQVVSSFSMSVVHWANYDIYDYGFFSEDGSLSRSASDPVPVEDTFTKGYKTGAALRRKRVLPVAYLYNGVRLPKLPEWDREKYPYACISYNVTVVGRYYLLIGTEPCYRNDTDGTYDFGVLALKRYNLLSDGTWKETTVSGDCYWIGNINREWDGKFPVWTTADIIREDGSVYLAASDPVPVYE